MLLVLNELRDRAWRMFLLVSKAPGKEGEGDLLLIIMYHTAIEVNSCLTCIKSESSQKCPVVTNIIRIINGKLALLVQENMCVSFRARTVI